MSSREFQLCRLYNHKKCYQFLEIWLGQCYNINCDSPQKIGPIPLRKPLHFYQFGIYHSISWDGHSLEHVSRKEYQILGFTK